MVSQFSTIKNIIQYTSLVCALFFNSLLIFLIQNKSPRKMGAYKSLMTYFCVFSIIFTVMDVIVQPYIITYETSFLMIINMKGRIISKDFAFTILCAHTGCFGVTLFLIAIHFIFRYFALERKGKLHYFQGWKILFWFCIPLIAGANWAIVNYIFFKPRRDLTMYIKDFIYEQYGLYSTEITYVGANFYEHDGSFDETVLIVFSNMVALMVIPFAVLIYCGRRSYIKIQQLILDGKSSFAKNLQKQLYKALVIQAALPICIMFIPFGIFFFGALFNLQLDKFSRFVTFCYAIYPAIDPIPIIFIVDNYRNALFSFFGISKKTNRIEMAEETCNIQSRY